MLNDPATFADGLAILKGADSVADAIAQRHNDREYYSQGVQSVLGVRLGSGGLFQQLEIGLRYHEDQEDRFQSEDGYRMSGGRKILTSVGAAGSQSNRVSNAQALALFVQDRLELGDLTITPGLRFESIRMKRIDFVTDDPERIAAVRERESGISVLVPGIGAAVRLGHRSSVFVGVHRGFSPPGPGADERVAAETSVNYELGWRHRGGASSAEVVGFFTDYENLLGADTLSSGGLGTGDQFNGGRAHVWGLELAGTYDLGNALGWQVASVPLAFSYTWTRGVFRSSFESDFGPWGGVQVGDELPYLARHQLYASIGVQRGDWSFSANLNSSSRMRSEAGKGRIPTGKGADAYAVVGLSTRLRIGARAVLHASVQNLFDQAYVVARRPAGARPGLPRTLMFSIQFHR